MYPEPRPSTIRLATAADAGPIAAIYAPFCTDSHVTFEVVAPTAADMQQRLVCGLRVYPWLVCETASIIDGYVYASAFRERAAYRWAAEVTVYLAPASRGRGIGRALYTTLLDLLRQQGFYQAHAGITLPNVASVGLHESMGFVPLSHYPNIGFKGAAWLDVGRWSLALRPHEGIPLEPLPISIILGQPGWDAAIAAGERWLQPGRRTQAAGEVDRAP